VTFAGSLARLAAALLVAALLLALGGADRPAAGAGPAKPEYLPYAPFGPDDPPAHVTLKRAYNDAVLRYNQALYDYHVTLEKHDHLVEIYNASTSAAERQKAREEAAPLLTRLTTLRREVLARAAAVDQAARQAAAGGVPIKR
jgi:hypothetical protein